MTLKRFRDFMEERVREFYTSEGEKFSAGGDFFTAPELDRAFGEAIADFLLPKLMEFSHPAVVELGAGRGLLARDFLKFIKERQPELFGKLTYYIYEFSKPLRERQREVLKDFPNVYWVEELPEVEGVVLSNEFFDCLPVHVVKGNRELYVSPEGEEVWLELRDERIEEFIKRMGYESLDIRIEVCLDCIRMLEKVARSLREGYHLVIDYGYISEEIEKFPEGTVIGYKKHKVEKDIYRKETMDISAQVNFSVLMEYGKDYGLETVLFDSQRNFLTSIPVFLETLESLALKEDPESVERLSRLKTMLISMGDRFKVLLQKKV